MKKKYFSILVSFLCLSPVASLANPDQGGKSLEEKCEASLHATLPKSQADSIKKSPIPGVCEISSGANVMYFYPNGDNGLLLAGAIIDKTGRNFTSERSQSLLGQKINNLPLDKSIQHGKGPVQVVIFTDVDCPYCRALEKGLTKYTDIGEKATINTFLYPLNMHPKSEAKSRFILCQNDKFASLSDVMQRGVLDNDESIKSYPAECASAAVESLLATGKQAGANMGVKGTPTIYVNGVQIRGNADMVYEAINKAYQLKLTGLR